jgi:hypothetical protein
MYWIGAFGFCKGAGMNLLTLADQNETLFFLDLVDKKAKYLESDFECLPEIFIGGTLSQPSSDRTTWNWFETGEKINFMQWAFDRPNGVPDSCLGIIKKKEKFGFTDVFCGYSSGRSFICQDVRAVSKGMNPNATLPKAGR